MTDPIPAFCQAAARVAEEGLRSLPPAARQAFAENVAAGAELHITIAMGGLLTIIATLEREGAKSVEIFRIEQNNGGADLH